MKQIPNKIHPPKRVIRANAYRVGETRNGEHKQYFFALLEKAKEKYKELCDQLA